MRGGERRSPSSTQHVPQQPRPAGPWGPPQGPHLCGYILVGSVFQQELDNFQMVFLRCHVEGCEAFLQTQGLAHQHTPSSLNWGKSRHSVGGKKEKGNGGVIRESWSPRLLTSRKNQLENLGPY